MTTKEDQEFHEADEPDDCIHDGPIERDDNGFDRFFLVCGRCDKAVRPGEEYGTWVTVE